MQIQELAKKCRAAGCETEEKAPMEQYTSFRIGGPADLLITAYDANQIQKAYGLCREGNIPMMILGNGTNLLVSDRGIRGAVLRLDGSRCKPESKDGQLHCFAGITLKKLCLFARDSGLAGLEFAYGIPGTVGGAVYMNAGAYGGQTADVLFSAEALFPDGSRRVLPAADMKMGYRHSVFMESDAVVTAVTFCLASGEPSEIGVRMDEILKRRRDKQPLEYPSAGSFFKRPEGHYAGALIEKSGLKGFTVGGAQVSEKHAGFVINRGGATFADVCRLSDSIRERVMKDSGVMLEPEVRFVGER